MKLIKLGNDYINPDYIMSIRRIFNYYIVDTIKSYGAFSISEKELKKFVKNWGKSKGLK